MARSGDHAQLYWRQNLRYLAVLLTIWFAVSFGAGILFVDQLDQVRFFGFRLGFWFAQQGAIYVFVVLIFVYMRLMNRLDERYGFVEETGLARDGVAVADRGAVAGAPDTPGKDESSR